MFYNFWYPLDFASLNSPLDQFECLDITLLGINEANIENNYGLGLFNFFFSLQSGCLLFIFIAVLLTTIWQSLIKNINATWKNSICLLIKDVYTSNVKTYREENKINLIFLFFTVLFSNLGGLIPFGFTVTSAFFFTFFLALFNFIYQNTFLAKLQTWSGFKLLLPSKEIYWISPFLIIIEIISYSSKVLSLSLRLFANMVAGHLMLKIVAIFLAELMSLQFVLANAFIYLAILLLILLETFLAFLQAYVFVLLTSIYANDLL